MRSSSSAAGRAEGYRLLDIVGPSRTGGRQMPEILLRRIRVRDETSSSGLGSLSPEPVCVRSASLTFARVLRPTWLVLLAMAVASAFAITASRAAASGPNGPQVEIRHGPFVSAASFSGGQLHETLTFHNAGTFVAHILSNPPAHPTSSGRLGGRTIALGHHVAGKAHISFRLGALKPGRYAVVITPEPQVLGPPRVNLATWVYLTVHGNGTIANIRLIHP
jgi:hypothetical protein